MPLPAPVPWRETGSGPPLLLIHGPFSTGEIWEGVAEELSDRFRTIRPDLRGRGPTPRRPASSHVEDLIGLMEALSLPSVHLVGHASGSSLAARVALRAPELAHSLAVVDPVIPRAPSRGPVQEAWHLEMIIQWLSVGHDDRVRRPENVTLIRQALSQQTLADLLPRESNHPGIPSSPSDLARLARLDCPVLAMVGARATDESKAVTASVFGQAHRFQFAQVPGASRDSPREAPQTVARLLASFLQSVEGERLPHRARPPNRESLPLPMTNTRSGNEDRV